MLVITYPAYRSITSTFRHLALVLIFNMLTLAVLTPTTNELKQLIKSTKPPIVSAPPQVAYRTCYDGRCQCRGFVLKCYMQGVTVLIDSGAAAITNTTRISINCTAHTTAAEIQRAQLAYTFWHQNVKFKMDNCVQLHELLTRPEISYTGTIKINANLPVPEGMLHNARGLHRLRLDVVIERRTAVVLPAQLLHKQSALKELRLVLLCKPHEVSLPVEIFHKLTALETLLVGAYQTNLNGIKNTALRNLTAAHFSNMPLLRKLHLNGNYMQTLAPNIFHELYELNELGLNLNELSALPADLLRAQAKLIKLDLAGNVLETLPTAIFATTPLLWELSLADNRLCMPANIIAALRPLRYLYRLNLSHNCLARISDLGVYDNRTLLERRHVRAINEAPYLMQYLAEREPVKRFERPHNATVINLSHNHITSFNFDMITAAAVQCPYELDFSENQIKHIYALTHPRRSYGDCTRKLSLQRNPLQCDCALAWIYQTNFSIATIWECASSDARKTLNLSRDMCAWKPQFCPVECNCRFDTRALLINCTNASLDSLTALPQPAQVSLAHSTLDITLNRFYELPSHLTFGYAYVTRLHAAQNQLVNVQSAHLPPRLEMLDLRDNRLSHLSRDFVLKYLNESAALQQIYLAGNPWLCNCDAEHLLYAIRAHRKRIPDAALLHCANLQNVSLLTVRFADICVPALAARVSQMWLLLSIALAIIVLVSFLALYYKYTLELHVWLYAHDMFLCCIREYELDRHKVFDAFISYAHQDATFVNDTLLPGLEQCEPPFRLCTHERNWLAGAFIAEQIVDSVAQSRRTIIVLSQHFIASDWARMEFRTAHQCALNEGRTRIILIKYGKLTDMSMVVKELRAYLDMNTYLEWQDHPWFWSKLRYAMPHRKGEVRDAGMLELNERQRVYVIGDVERNQFQQRKE